MDDKNRGIEITRQPVGFSITVGGNQVKTDKGRTKTVMPVRRVDSEVLFSAKRSWTSLMIIFSGTNLLSCLEGLSS